MSHLRCTTCAAWQPTNASERTGECRRRSPHHIQPGSITRRIWPTTAPGDWCFEHEHRWVDQVPANGADG